MNGVSLLPYLAQASPNVTDWLASPINRLVVAAIVSGCGIWMMLPSHGKIVRRVGGLFSFVGGCLLFSAMPLLGNLTFQGLFSALAALTALGAVATVTSRNPVYCAIWFAVTLLGTGGLFLVNGAQFLGVATVAVYAGAIVVTFLFVLMLSQPEGHAYYDRMSWGVLPSIFGIVVGVGFILLTSAAILRVAPTANESANRQVLQEQHVAGLGAQLFSSQLVAVQAAGALLLAALVAAVAIASAGKPRVRRGPVGQPGLDGVGQSIRVAREGGRIGG